MLALLAPLSVLGCAENDIAYAGTAFDYPKHQIVLDAAMNGESDFSFLLDSAVDPSVVDAELAESYNLIVSEETRQAEGAGDEEGLDIQLAKIAGLSVGGAAFEPIEAVAADLSSFDDALSRDIAGILG